MTRNVLSLLILLAGLAPRIGLAGLIGEPAPPLVVQAWLKGQPVEIKPGTNMYVVEIWSTTSRASALCVTNLNRLQARYKTNGVVVVAICDEPVEKIKGFVTRGGTNIEYAVAADEHGRTAMSYLTAVKQRAIPHAFVVGTNGTVLWHGPPLGLLNEVLAQITAGQYNLAHFKKFDDAPIQMEQYLGLAQRGDFRAKEAGSLLLAERTNEVFLLCDMAYQIATSPRLKNRDFALAGAALDQAEKLDSAGTESTNKSYDKSYVMSMRAVWLFTSGQHDAGLMLATQALALAQSPMDTNRIQVLLKTMEAHLTPPKSNPGNTNKIEAVPVPDHNPAANTNQDSGSTVKP